MTLQISRVVLLIFGFTVSRIAAQDISPADLKEDLTFLKQAIETYHPALDTYCPGFDKDFQQILMQADREDSLSWPEYFQQISSLCAACHEGHFSLGNWSDTVHAGFLNNRYRYLPMSVAIVGGKLYVWHDYSNEQQLRKGDEILSINDAPAGLILETLSASMPSDGDIQTYPIRQIEVGFSWRYFLYIDQPEALMIDVMQADGTRKLVSMTALTRQQQTENYRAYISGDSGNTTETDEPFYEFSIEENIAWLRLPSFDRGRSEEAGIKATKLYKSIFRELSEKQVGNLVVDLRGNTGGLNEFADEMVPYLQAQKSDIPFLRQSISWEGKERTYNVPRASKFAFEGDIYVLVNGLTYSNGSTVARFLREFAGATVIGEETGTRYEGFVAGSRQYVTLPNSGLRIGIPRYHLMFPSPTLQDTRNRGVVPDVLVTETMDSRVSEQDLFRETVFQLISQSGE